MMKEKIIKQIAPSFSCKARLKSFVYAGSGISKFFKTEHNAQIHLAATVLVIALSFFLKISKTETIAIIFSVALVWATEILNTAIEKIMNFISMENHPQIKYIKDISAAAVLVAAIAAAMVGIIIFLPKLL